MRRGWRELASVCWTSAYWLREGHRGVREPFVSKRCERLRGRSGRFLLRRAPVSAPVLVRCPPEVSGKMAGGRSGGCSWAAPTRATRVGVSWATRSWRCRGDNFVDGHWVKIGGQEREPISEGLVLKASRVGQLREVCRPLGSVLTSSARTIASPSWWGFPFDAHEAHRALEGEMPIVSPAFEARSGGLVRFVRRERAEHGVREWDGEFVVIALAGRGAGYGAVRARARPAGGGGWRIGEANSGAERGRAEWHRVR